MTLLDVLLRALRPKTNRSWPSVIVGVGLGMAAGVIGGILIAPRSGERTREIVAEKVKDAASRVKASVNDASAGEE